MKKVILSGAFMLFSLFAVAQETPFTLHTPTGDLFGTLTIPETHHPVPVVLLIAGSGPTDRDGNNTINLKTNSYKQLADSLLKSNIAVLRYDKRGIAASHAAYKSEADVVFTDYVKDAVLFAKTLKADKRFSKVYIAGHSEGSLIGMMAAEEVPVAGFISIAGAGEPAGKTLRRQLARVPAMAPTINKMLDTLESGHTLKGPIDPNLMALFRPSIQPYMISWLKLDPTQEIAKLHIPVLIIQGTTDIQVSKEDADWLKAASPKATLVIIDGMSHIFKTAPADIQANYATYQKPELPIRTELVQAIRKFMR
ncbi:hypothetical protein CLV59_104440 [Chitinophaga dinghuensis]|uniref:Serine aminopeptidase S33 domain-containing protein n=1 Tax=Chitinophaga dinghuensis TaxID=1539050 RepID=A0A327W1U2_9BACT|nr:alpha/beta fold hydrolase [Chitinophaga dinghuensis]RAJ82215.1 hypothetical protein CLV59_104440 [Chitinophaga dinghuensis]